MLEKTAANINTLGAFLGKRDLPVLNRQALWETYQISQADVMVLFGGSILNGGRVLAEAMKDQTAKTYVIVGGEGHTTETLRQKMHREFPDLETAGLPEAKVFAAYLERQHGLAVDFLECDSTNCGNNITYLLALLKEKGIPFQSIILAQDATMQRRMEAGLQKYVGTDVTIINYAVYQAEVAAKGGELVFKEDIWGMWEMERYISLLMGEIPRLSDEEGGYGPKGKDFIAHVDIPGEVRAAFEELREVYGVREANPLYASGKG